MKDGEDVDPEKVEFLPLGFDEFYGREASPKEESPKKRLLTAVENACNPVVEKLQKWSEEKKKESEIKKKLVEAELELIEEELQLEEAIEDMDEELKRREKEEEKKIETDFEEKEDTLTYQDENVVSSKVDEDRKGEREGKGKEEDGEEKEKDEEEEEEEDDEDEPSSFGTVIQDQGMTKNDQKGNKPGQSPFSTSSLSFASFSLTSMVSCDFLQNYFWILFHIIIVLLIGCNTIIVVLKVHNSVGIYCEKIFGDNLS